MQRGLEIRLIREHVLCDGFLKNYTKWIWHGEFVDVTSLYVSQYSNIHFEDRMEDIIHDIEEDSFQQAHMCDSLKDDSETPFYLSCSSFTHLSTILKLINIKGRNAWIDKSFTELPSCCMKCFQKIIHCPLVIMRRRRYCIRWVWSTRKYMHVPMIAYCIEKSLNHCTSAQDARYHDTK